MKLNHILNEISYGSLIDKEKYNDLDNADKTLYRYTADSISKIDHYFSELLERYPFKGGIVFRGLHFDSQEQYENFISNINNGFLELSESSSWTRFKETAADFAHTKKSYFPTPDLMNAESKRRNSGEHMTGYAGVVLKTNIKPNIAIDVNLSEFAKEDEIILPKGKYKVDIVFKAEPFNRKYTNIQAAFDDLKRGDKKSKQIIEWLLLSKFDELSSSQIDTIIKYKYGVILKISISELKDNVIVDLIKNYKSNTFELKIDTPFILPIDLYKRASKTMQTKFDKMYNIIDNELNAKILKLESLENVIRMNINDLTQYANSYHHSKAIKSLKAIAVKTYNKVNEKNYAKSNNIPLNQLTKTLEILVKIMSL
jgi:hypothetical protein